MDPQGFIQDYRIRNASFGPIDATDAYLKLADKPHLAWLVRLSSVTDMFCVSVRDSATRVSHHRYPADTSWTVLTEKFGEENHLHPYALLCGEKWSQVMVDANQKAANMQKEQEKR